MSLFFSPQKLWVKKIPFKDIFKEAATVKLTQTGTCELGNEQFLHCYF